MFNAIKCTAATLAICVVGTVATAAEGTAPTAPETADIGIPPEEWKSMVLGRTVTYLIDGEVWAQEAYDRASDKVAIRLVDGTCMEGTWSYRNGEYCFMWDAGEYSCFIHTRLDNRILVVPVVEGNQVGTIQTVGGVSDLPLMCGPALTS